LAARRELELESSEITIKHFGPKNLFLNLDFFYIFWITIRTNKGSKRTPFLRGLATKKSVADPDQVSESCARREK
jgi:hypothetical protein